MTKINLDKESVLNAKRLRATLSYNKSTGEFTWAKAMQGVRQGSVAGCLKRPGTFT